VGSSERGSLIGDARWDALVSIAIRTNGNGTERSRNNYLSGGVVNAVILQYIRSTYSYIDKYGMSLVSRDSLAKVRQTHP
jgi:hypothetical protein